MDVFSAVVADVLSTVMDVAFGLAGFIDRFYVPNVHPRIY